MNIISNLLNFSLDYFFNITGDLGIAIILLTIAVRLLLMPLSFKQKLSIQGTQKISKDLEKIKAMYKNNQEKLDMETKKYYAQNAKGMMGCLVGFLQLPIIFALYNVVLKMPLNAGTMLLPWVASLKMTDSLFIIPTLYTLAMLSPNILPSIPFLKVTTDAKLNKVNLVITSFISIIITFKAPVALGIYFITTSLFSFVEDIAFRLYMRRRTVIA